MEKKEPPKKKTTTTKKPVKKEVKEEKEKVEKVKCEYCGKKVDASLIRCPHCCAYLREEDKPVVEKKEEVKEERVVPPPVESYAPPKKKSNALLFSLIGGGIAILFITVLLLGILIVPRIFAKPEKFLARGDYEKAYNLAKKDEEKDKVLLENMIAFNSYEIQKGLKDPTSFRLKNVYYNGTTEIVYEVVAKNSYGTDVTNYYDYRYDSKKNTFTLFVYLPTLNDETVYSSDSSDKRLEKIIKNVVRGTVKKMIADSSMKQDEKLIERINKLFKEDKLKDVKLIKEIDKLYDKAKAKKTTNNNNSI
jgi:hypothetical protein